MVITIEDTKRLEFVFNKRIQELEELIPENLDMKENIKLKIQEYYRTLNKYKSFDETNKDE